MADVDYFLKIDGIPGESLDDKHRDEIQVESWRWGEQNAGTFAFGGGGAGKVNMGDFRFLMKVNKATPQLFLACATGQHIKSAILTARKAGKEQQDYLKIEFTDLLVSSYSSGDGSIASVIEPEDDIGDTGRAVGSLAGEFRSEVLRKVREYERLQTKIDFLPKGRTNHLPLETFSINFAQIKIDYRMQQPDGKLGAPMRAGYNLKTETAV
jgi:type VI secretion system secreted protein Hcp